MRHPKDKWVRSLWQKAQRHENQDTRASSLSQESSPKPGWPLVISVLLVAEPRS